MKKIFLIVLIFPFIFSCSHKKDLIYLNDLKLNSLKKVDFYIENKIEIGDILKIDINTVVPEASIAYNSFYSNNANSNTELLIINGYLVNKDSTVNYPVLGEINVVGFSERKLALKLRKLLIEDGHLNNPYVNVKIINSKFTVLGEVRMPGTYSNYDNRLNIFQALGVAGDLLITAKRNNVTLIRIENGLRKTYKFSLNNSELIDKPYYYIKSNDIIIVEPNFSKVKSAGFIGSPSSIASISSLLLSITLLLINNPLNN